MRQVKFFIRLVGNLNDLTGKIVAMCIIPMVFVLAYEVFMRYVPGNPTIWAPPIWPLKLTIPLAAGL